MFDDNFQVYGVRKVWRQLNREGENVARCTVPADEAMGFGARATKSDRSALCPLDKVNRQFEAPRPNALWVSDFTYVATWQGFVYVAFVIDTFARRIVGWRASRTAHAGFVLDALEQALCERRPVHGGGLVHHSDRGVQYVSIKYTERLAKAGVEPSVGSVGDVTITLSPRRSTGSSKPKSSGGAAHGATSKPSSSPPSNGSTGSIIEDCWSRSEISRRPRPKTRYYARRDEPAIAA